MKYPDELGPCSASTVTSLQSISLGCVDAAMDSAGLPTQTSLELNGYFEGGVMRWVGAVADKTGAKFVQAAPYVLIGSGASFALLIVFYTVKGELGSALTLALGLLTGVQAPADTPLSGSGALQWAVTIAGWLILPTTVALVLGAAERKIERDEDLAFALSRIVTRLNVTPEQREKLVQKVLEERRTWLTPKKN